MIISTIATHINTALFQVLLCHLSPSLMRIHLLYILMLPIPRQSTSVGRGCTYAISKRHPGDGGKPCLWGDSSCQPVHVSVGQAVRGHQGHCTPEPLPSDSRSLPMDECDMGLGQGSPVSKQTLGWDWGIKSNCITSLEDFLKLVCVWLVAEAGDLRAFWVLNV